MSEWDGVGADSREKRRRRREGGRGQKEGFWRRWWWWGGAEGATKQTSMRAGDESGINNVFSLVGTRRGEQVSGAAGQQTASFLPVRQRGDRKGHQRGSLGRRWASCRPPPWGSGDKCIQVAGGATCAMALPPPISQSTAARWEGEGRGGRVSERGKGLGVSPRDT